MMFQETHRFSYEQIEAELDRFRGEAPPSPQRSNREVREILASIHRDPFASELNVKWLKKHCRIRDSNISCRFRRAMGVLIKDYIEELRIRAACHLLMKSQFSIFDIALSVGYSYPQTFYNAFRRRLGCTPTSYRKHIHNDVMPGPRSSHSEHSERLGEHPTALP